MIPIASEVFWGPMAYAIIGGLFVATLLTLLFLPALYVAWFRVKEPAQERPVRAKAPAQRTPTDRAKSHELQSETRQTADFIGGNDGKCAV
jgi:hypothetical protein